MIACLSGIASLLILSGMPLAPENADTTSRYAPHDLADHFPRLGPCVTLNRRRVGKGAGRGFTLTV